MNQGTTALHPVTTAVIPVAGLGTRLLPASKAIPKEMVPVVDRPLIQHVVEEAVAAGIRRIVLVTRAGKEAIENHFDRHAELEAELQRKGKTDLLDAVNRILPPGVEILSVRQPRAAGLGDAIRCAAPAVGDQAFAVLLPDVLVDAGLEPGWNLGRMVRAYARTGLAQLLVEPVPREWVHRYGIVDCGASAPARGNAAPVRGMVEKPSADEAPSNLAIVGRYVLPPRVMSLLRSTGVGAGGEVQLTDAMLGLLDKPGLAAMTMRGASFDCGTKAGFVKANLALALRDPDIGGEIRRFATALEADVVGDATPAAARA